MKQFAVFLALFIFLTACSPATVISILPETTAPAIPASTPEPMMLTTATAVPLGQIAGIVWHDLCQAGLPGQPGYEAPPIGCITGEQGGYQANGLYDTDEPGIENTLISLGYGTCGTGDDYYEIITDKDGNFTFNALGLGDYCLVVDSLRPENGHLLPGGWTFPLEYDKSGVIQIPLTLSADTPTAHFQIGWDYQFLPIPPPMQPTTTPITICTNLAAFVSDITIPDDTHLKPVSFKNLDRGQLLEGKQQLVFKSHTLIKLSIPKYGVVF